MNKTDLIGSFMDISSTELTREHKSILIEASFRFEQGFKKST